MRILLAGAMALLLLRSGTAMGAVSESCRLFVTSVLPGLLPYMVLSQMLLSRMEGKATPALLILLGWCGDSPSGARLMADTPGLSRRQRVQVAVSTATMSPMFLAGTCGMWLGSPLAGGVLLFSVLLGGWLTGLAAGACTREGSQPAPVRASGQGPVSFGTAVEQSARTLLMVCGTMAIWRMFASLAAEAWPGASLPLTTVLEVTAGIREIAALPLPLGLRTALTAGAAGMGGLAILMQNRAVHTGESQPMRLPLQLFWQEVHGAVSFFVALGAMRLLGQA